MQQMHAILSYIRPNLDPKALFLDCSRNKLEAVFVPYTNYMQLMLNGSIESYCAVYIQEKDQRDRWIVMDEGGRLYPSHNGWTEKKRWGRTVLWFQKGSVR